MLVKKCDFCGAEFLCCRNKKQRYCSKKECQNHRRNLSLKQKRAVDPDYRLNQKAAERKWRSRNKKYWQNYRSQHPGYVKRNRELQQLRDQLKKAKKARATEGAAPRRMV